MSRSASIHFLKAILVRVTSVCTLVHVVTAAAGEPQLTFLDSTVAARISVLHGGDSKTVFENHMTGGGAVGDFNNDGHQDLFLALGLEPDRLFINNGDGTFRDATPSSGITGGSTGAAVGDYDGDGWLDIFATGPTSFAKLYHNNGDGTFMNLAVEAGVSTTGAVNAWSFGATFGDYDLDGDLDLFVAARELSFDEPRTPNRLYRNNGNGTFEDVTEAIGLFDGVETPLVNFIVGYSPRMVDMDGDRAPELLLVNDFGTSLYFANDGDGTFTNLTSLIPELHTFPGELMGQAVADFNGDGLLDWYISNTPPGGEGTTGNQLFLNQGNHSYDEVGGEAGADQGYWGWGTVAVDFNHDGLVDLAETNGWGNGYVGEPSVLFLHNGVVDGVPTFVEVAEATGFVHNGMGRGMLNLDFDDDGDQDVVIISNNELVTLFRNDLSGADTNWLRIFLDSGEVEDLAPNGMGAKVIVSAGGASQVRSIDGGCQYLTTSELSAHFGLGGATVVDEVLVQWPNGLDTVLTNVPVNQVLTISADSVVRCPADIDDNGNVGPFDLALLLGNWGPNPGHPADIDGNGDVGPFDMALLLGHWGPCG